MALFKKEKPATKHYDGTEMFNVGAQWNSVNSGRGPGKSYWWKRKLLQMAVQDIDKPKAEQKHKMFYLRRYSDDVSPTLVEQYFADMVVNRDGDREIEKMTKGKYNNVRCGKNNIWLVKYNDDGEEVKDVPPFLVGRYNNIGNAERLKSNSQFAVDTDFILFEEYIASSKPFLPNEVQSLVSLVSTIFRDRPDGKIIMIGNCETLDNPYFEYFNLTKIVKKMKPGDITVHHFGTGEYDDEGNPEEVSLAVEISDVKKRNVMFFGQALGQNGSVWGLGTIHPTIRQDQLKQFEELYRIKIHWHSQRWSAQLFLDDAGGMFWFIKPQEKITKSTDRIISDRVSGNLYHSASLYPINKVEQVGFELMRQGKIFYCSNECGEDFTRAWPEIIAQDISQLK